MNKATLLAEKDEKLKTLNKEVLFAEKLEQVKKLAREQGQCVSEEQVKETFAELALGEEQLGMVYDYLKKHNVGIGEPAELSDYLESQEIDYLKMYQDELKLLDEVSEGEKEAIILSAMAGDTDAQSKLIEIFLPQVVELSKLYAGQGVFLEDLIGEGNVALTMGVTMIGAMEHADEAEGMLSKLVMDAMEALIKENFSQRERDNKLAEKINRVADRAKELADDLGREVTIEELVNETSLSRKAIKDAIRLSGNRIDNLVPGEENDD